MKLVNNLYYEALYAHFKYYFFQKPEDALMYDGECFICEGYRFTEHFFDWFDLTKAKNEEDAIILLKRDYEEMKTKSRKLPKLEGVALPTAIYYEFWGIKLALKELIVPHPDGNASSVRYRYHFYRLWPLLKFLFTPNAVKRAILFNDRLKTRTTQTVYDVFEKVVNDTLTEANKETVTKTTVEEKENRLEYFVAKMTTRCYCLFALQVLKNEGYDYRQESLTDVARIVSQFLNKEIPVDAEGKERIEHSYVYKVLKKIRKLTDEELQKDYLVVKEFFEWGGDVFDTPYLFEIAKQLETKVKR